jgi:hypothetical protein
VSATRNDTFRCCSSKRPKVVLTENEFRYPCKCKANVVSADEDAAYEAFRQL